MIYMGTTSGIYGPPIVLGTVTTHRITNLTPGQTYYFAIAAYDIFGNEGSLSNEVSKSIY